MRSSVKVVVGVGMAVAMGMMMAAMPAPPQAPQAPTTQHAEVVTVSGVMHAHVMAVGGETTGTEIGDGDKRYELDLGEDKELMKKAEELDGKEALATGTLTVKAGVERKERKIVHVTKLEAGK